MKKLKTEKMIARKEGGIGWMIFNNPQRHNAMSLDMWEAVPEIMAGFAADEEVRVIVLRGAGERAFVSGADISEFEKVRASKEETIAYDRKGDVAMDSILHSPKPTIAMVNGFCMGGGAAIAISCDLRMVSEKSRFGIPAAKLGVGYQSPGIRKLMDLVGPSFTKEIFFTGRQFSAEEALAMGLVNRVLPEEQLEGYVLETAGSIAGNAPLTINAVKATVMELVKDPGQRDLSKTEAMVAACFDSEDYTEGRQAFMEKRPAQFKGR